MSDLSDRGLPPGQREIGNWEATEILDLGFLHKIQLLGIQVLVKA